MIGGRNHEDDTAIMRTIAFEHIVKKLEHMSIRSLTISEIKGTGEEVPLFKRYTIHDKIEIMVPDNKANDEARAILEDAGTGLAGDGIIDVFTLDCALKIRTMERMI
jgi:nitrogen regulatory protein PII